MITKYNTEIDNNTIINNIDRLTNQIFKLLPGREEGGNWISPLNNIILELAGMSKVIQKEDDIILFRLLCKLEALKELKDEDDFLMFRTTIFECLGLCNNLKGNL